MKKTIITIVSLIVLLTVVLYGYEFIFKKPVITSPTIDQNEEIPLQALDVKEQYIDSEYTFVGRIPVPTPCHTLVSKVQPTAPGVFQIQVTITPPAQGIMCAQVVTDKDFKVSFDAPEGIEVTALLNGVVYDLNRFIIPEGENIDTFELFIKG